jgi:LPXTG-motif cell wall-anchored protein
MQTYGCFMVTDPACPATATARAVPFAIVGMALILVAIWLGIRRRRRGDAG